MREKIGSFAIGEVYLCLHGVTLILASLSVSNEVHAVKYVLPNLYCYS